MPIDSGSGLSFVAEYPVPNVNQSSQQFRDNFAIIQGAIERIHLATSDADSPLTLATTVSDADGAVTQALRFKDNVLRLPHAVRSTSIQPGSVFFDLGNDVFEFKSLNAWGFKTRDILATNSIKIFNSPVNAEDVVTLGYLNSLSLGTGGGYALGGLQVFKNGDALGPLGSVTALNITGPNVNVTQSNATVTLGLDVDLATVRSEMRTYFTDQYLDTSGNLQSTGIDLVYDARRDKIQIGPRDFKITLQGAVKGEATVTRLGDVTLNTTSDAVLGISLFGNNLPVSGPTPATAINFVGPLTVTQDDRTATVTIANGLNLQNVRDEVGRFVSGSVYDASLSQTTESGITVNYDAANNALLLGVREFTVSLTGAVEGSARISKLRDATIVTTTDLIRGITLQSNAVATGSEQSVKTLNFSGPVTLSQSGSVVDIKVADGLSIKDVQDVVGGFVSGTIRDTNTLTETETGIFVNYDESNARLELVPRDFNVTLSGAVSGTGTVSRLRDVTINTTSDRIRGLTLQANGTALGGDQSVQVLNFTGEGVTASQNANTVTVNIPKPITILDMRNVVGSTVRATSRDPNTNIQTETGITVNYDSENEVVELGVKDFNINLVGAVTGSATVSRLKDVTINTATSAIDGLVAYSNGILVNKKVTEINFSGTGYTTNISGSTLNIDFSPAYDETSSISQIASMLVGNQIGSTVSYDATNQKITLENQPLNLNLIGDVYATGTLVYERGQPIASLTLTTALAFGHLGVSAGNAPLGNGVNTLDFYGLDVSLTPDGKIARISAQRPYQGESFTILAPSSDLPNARTLKSGDGITITDGGPGGDVEIAVDPSVLTQSNVLIDGNAITTRSTLEISSNPYIRAVVTDDVINNKTIVNFVPQTYAWFLGSFDCGLITDKYGSIFEMGSLGVGIIETQADFGTL